MSTESPEDIVRIGTSPKGIPEYSHDTGIIMVFSSRKDWKDTFCELVTGAPFHSMSNVTGASDTMHLKFSYPCYLQQPVEYVETTEGLTDKKPVKTKRHITAIQLISMTEFGGVNASLKTNVDIFASLCALLAVLNMRSQPFLGVLFLGDSSSPRIGGVAGPLVDQLAKHVIGEGRSQFQFVSTSWYLRPPGKKEASRMELNEGKLRGFFANSFNPTKDPALAGRYRFTRLTQSPDSALAIASSFLNNTEFLSQLSMPWLQMQLPAMDQLSSTAIGGGYINQLNKAISNLESDIRREIGRVSEDLLREYLDESFQLLAPYLELYPYSNVFEKATEEKDGAGELKPLCAAIKEITKGKTFILVFDDSRFLGPSKAHLPVIPADTDDHYFISINAFHNATDDAIILTQTLKCLAFMNIVGLDLSGLALIMSDKKEDVPNMLASIKLLSKICGPSCLKYLVLVKSKWLDDDRALYKLDTLVPEASCLTKDDKNLGSTKASISALLNSLIQPGFVLSEKLAACQEFIWKQETFSATTPGVEVQDFLTKKLVDQQEKFRSNRHDVAGGDAARLLPIWESQVDILLLQWALIRFTGSSNIYKDVAQKVEEDAGVEKAMTRLTAIISLQSDLHSDKGNKVAQLGDMYNAHFKLYGKTEDLTVAIKQYDQAAALIPDDDLEKKAEYLSILGSHLQKKFQLFGDKNDVLRAIQACKDAVDLQYRADGSDNANLKKALAQHALGALLKKKFADYFDDPNDIDGAIDCFNEAKRFTPYGHRANQIIFSDLCHSHVLKSKYHSMKNDIPAAVLDIETAIEQYNRTLPEPGPDHPGYAMILDAKCMAYAKHHKLVKVQGNPSKHTPDIHEAIRAGEMAAEHGKETPQECAYLLNLGKAYWYSYEESRQAAPSADGASSLTKAVDCFHHAAQCDTADKMVRFKAARNWAKLEGEKLVLATKKDPTVTLRAYEYCIILLAEIAGQEIPIHEQYRRLERIQKVVHQATAAAITHDRLDKAVEFFEEGRSVIWRHYFKHDVVMQALKEKDPEKAKEYSLFLDKLRSHAADAESSTTYFKATVGDKDAQDNSSPGFMGRLAARASALVTKAKNAIKGLMGFEFFGMYKKLSILDNAAENGPIILINLCDEQCDALIIQWKKPVVRVNLPAMNNTKAEELQKDLRVLLGEGTSHARGPLIARGIKPALSVDTTLRENSMETILKELWITVVGPVVKALDKSYNKKSPLSHIFWCSSGHLAFLPLHAAGDYAFKDPKSKEVRILPSLFHSSYIPNIFAMLRRHNGDDSGSKFQLLAVAQSNTPNQLPLPQTIPEVDHLKNHSVAKDFSTVLKNEEGSVERVKEELLKSQWAHFACHGVQDRVDGLKSALLLEGGNKLTLKDLVDLKIPLAEFAFLSACQSAKGDITLPEEHIHLAAGMIVAGYQGVVATMWSIKDEDGLSIAKAVYDKLFAEKKGGWFGGSKGTAKPDFKEAVGALNEAVTDLRVNGKADYLRWVPFVHIGL